MVAVEHKFYRGRNFQKVLASAQIPNIFQTRMNRLGSSNESYVIKQKQILKCSTDQKALVIMDVFTGQMTTAVLDAFKEGNICIANVPANMLKFYQPVILTVSGYCKDFSNVNLTNGNWAK